MDEQLFIESLIVKVEFVKQMQQLIESMKKIKVFEVDFGRIYPKTMMEIAILKQNLEFYDGFYSVNTTKEKWILDIVYDETNESLKQEFEGFRRIFLVNLFGSYYEQIARKLNIIGKASLGVENLYLTTSNSEEFEEFTNPDFYKGGLKYLFNQPYEEMSEITDKTYKNLNIVKPNQIRIDWGYSNFDYNKTLYIVLF